MIIYNNNEYFKSPFLFRREYFENGHDKLKSCSDTDYNNLNFELKIDCEQMCKVECNFKHYPFEVFRMNKKDPALLVYHSSQPVIIYRHVPVMNLVGFIYNFGGMLGMWFGLFYLVNKVVYVRKTFHSYSTKVDRQIRIRLGN